MTTRPAFHRSALVRGLAAQGVGAASEPSETVAERLGQWLAWTDAQALFTELQGASSAPRAARAAAPTTAGAVLDEFHRVRGDLTRAITSDPVFADAGADAATCRRHHLALQQTMETRVGALRARVRAALATASPALARLAALDALLEQPLVARERQLLAAVPVLLVQRAARTRLAGDDVPVVDRTTMQEALLAELALRLQPVEGLLEALGAAQEAAA